MKACSFANLSHHLAISKFKVLFNIFKLIIIVGVFGNANCVVQFTFIRLML